MLTTPFEYVPSCTNTPVTTTSLVSKFYWAETTTTLQVTAPDEGDDRFSSCQPPGWDSGPTESPFSFSPAVCPSGWTAYSLSTTLSTITIAYCCDRCVSPNLRPCEPSFSQTIAIPLQQTSWLSLGGPGRH